MLRGFIKDSIIYGLSIALSKLIMFISIPIFTRAMSVESYGVIAFVSTLIGLAGIVMKAGTNNAVQRHYFDVDQRDQNGIIFSGLRVLFMVSFSTLCMALLLGLLFENYFFNQGISIVVIISALVYMFILQYIVFIKDIARLYFKPWLFFLLETAPVALAISMAMALILLLNLDVEGYFIGFATASIVVLIASYLFIKKSFDFKTETKFKKDLFLYGYPFIFVGLASWVFQSADRWMLLDMVGSKEVGLYSVAYQIASILLLLVTTFGIVWSPYAMKLLKHNRHKDIYASVGVVWYLIVALVGMTIALFFEEVVYLLLDERYYSCVQTGILLVATIIFIGTVQISVFGITIAKKTAILPWITLVVALLNIALNYYLIPIYFSYGAAISTLVCNFLLTILYLIYSQKYYFIPYSKTKFILITAIIVLFFTLLSNTGSLSIESKTYILAVLMLFFIGSISYEGKRLMRLLGQ